MWELKCYFPVHFSILMLMSAWLTRNKSHKIITIGYPKKKGAVEDMEFPWVLKEKHAERVN